MVIIKRHKKIYFAFRNIYEMFWKIFISIFLLSSSTSCFAQRRIDSLQELIASSKEDTSKILLLEELGNTYRSEKKLDSGISAFKQALELNEKTNHSLLKQCW